MTARLPRAAGRVLQEGTLCYLAVATRHGPHLTPVVYALDGGRIWLTTSRTSVKARALRRDRGVAGLVRTGDLAVAFRGRARTYDALDPLSWSHAVVAGPRLMRAATRFSLRNARFFAGYAVDARRVTLAWTPPGRVFVGVEVTSGALLDPVAGKVVSLWGQWGANPPRIRYKRKYSALPARRGLDLRVPRSVRSAVGAAGEGALAMGEGDSIVLPVRWRRIAREGSYEATLARAFLEVAGDSGSEGLGEKGCVALAVDRLSSWRAADMAGMLLQGPGDAFTLPDGLALMRIRPRRVVWWEGWSSGSVNL